MHNNLAIAGLAVAFTISAPCAAQAPAEGNGCPPGQTEVRPGRCQAPELAPPSIVDYRPRSTLVVPEHPVPRAKYPAIDFHGHPRAIGSAAELE